MRYILTINKILQNIFQDEKLQLKETSSNREKVARVRFVATEYLNLGFITTNDINNKGAFIDEFEIRCCPYIVIDHTGDIIATERVIFGKIDELPIFNLRLATNLDLQLQMFCEVSQLIVRRDFRISKKKAFFSLMKILIFHAANVAEGKGINTLCAVVNRWLYHHLTSIGFPVQLIGSPQILTKSPYHDQTELYPIICNTQAIKQVVGPLLISVDLEERKVELQEHRI